MSQLLYDVKDMVAKGAAAEMTRTPLVEPYAGMNSCQAGVEWAKAKSEELTGIARQIIAINDSKEEDE